MILPIYLLKIRIKSRSIKAIIIQNQNVVDILTITEK